MLWMIVGGGFCLLLSYWKLISESEQVNGFLESVGTAVLAGGAFGVLLKSLQYTGVFKKELEDVIYDYRFLEKRKDITDIWKNVSRVLYERKFPEISDKIEEGILKTYLPRTVNFYYNDFFFRCEIKPYLDTKKYLEVFETVSFAVKVASSSETVSFPYRADIDKEPSDTVPDYKLLALTVNGADRKSDCKISIDSNAKGGEILLVNLSLELTGCEEYKVEIKQKKIYALNRNNTKGFHAGRFINNLEVYVSYSNELKVEFYPMGILEDFIDRSSRNLIWKRYEGLIFPRQGFRLVFEWRT